MPVPSEFRLQQNNLTVLNSMPKYRTSIGSVMFKVGLHTVNNLPQKIEKYKKTVFCKGKIRLYEAYPESKDTMILNMYNIFNLQKRHCELITCT
jgi:hypothetical protein